MNDNTYDRRAEDSIAALERRVRELEERIAALDARVLDEDLKAIGMK